jgi:putative protease
VKDRYLLSLKDLNLSQHLEELIDAGISTFKIEGRLKDTAYVVNTVSYYRKLLDAILEKRKLAKNSSGKVTFNFEPNLEKTFNRGFTDFNFANRQAKIGSIDTPKTVGEFVGTVKKVEKQYFIIDTKLELHSGDGICFFDWQNNLSGTTINEVEFQKVYAQKMNEIHVGQKIYRNFDHQFAQKLENQPADRKIRLSINLTENDKGLVISGIDEDGNKAQIDILGEKKIALKVDAAKDALHNQLTRLGNTIFECEKLEINTAQMYFVPASQLNEARRQLVEKLIMERRKNRPVQEIKFTKNEVPYFEKHLKFNGNVINKKAKDFYYRHGVETIEEGAETGLNLIGQKVMTTKYCLRKELNMCKPNAEPLVLQDEDEREYKVKFLCGKCGMEIYLEFEDGN